MKGQFEPDLTLVCSPQDDFRSLCFIHVHFDLHHCCAAAAGLFSSEEVKLESGHQSDWISQQSITAVWRVCSSLQHTRLTPLNAKSDPRASRRPRRQDVQEMIHRDTLPYKHDHPENPETPETAETPDLLIVISLFFQSAWCSSRLRDNGPGRPVQ